MTSFNTKFRQDYEDFLARKLNGFEAHLSALGEAVKTGANEVGDGVLDSFQAGKEALKQSFQKLKATEADAYDSARAKFNQDLHSFEDSLDQFQQKLDLAAHHQKAYWEMRLASVGTHIDHLVGWVKGAEEGVKEEIHEDLASARNKLHAAEAALKNFVAADEKAMHDVWKGFVSAWDDLSQAFRKAVHRF